MPTTLLNKAEAKHHVNISGEFPDCDWTDILSVEETEFHEVLGPDFYDDLKDDLHDYSSKPSYDGDSSYNAGDIVEYEGRHYEALQSTSARPYDTSAWKVADKFQTATYQDFWERYLGKLLSYHLLKHTITSTTVEISAKGVVRKTSTEGSFEPVNEKFLNKYNAWIDTQIEKTLENAYRWIDDQDLDAYDNWLDVEGSYCYRCCRPWIADVYDNCGCDYRGILSKKFKNRGWVY